MMDLATWRMLQALSVRLAGVGIERTPEQIADHFYRCVDAAEGERETGEGRDVRVSRGIHNAGRMPLAFELLRRGLLAEGIE